MNNKKESPPISLFESIFPLIVMMLCLTLGSLAFEVGSEMLIVVLIISATVAGIIAIRRGCTWDSIQKAAGDKLADAVPALIILLTIGMLVGTWMFSGTIPMLVFFGIQWINPTYIVLTAFLITSLMSLTGSSWAAAGTIGVALMGVAHTVDAPLAATAGAIISGAYFGDKLSPLSDTTNICAMAAKANLYDHIRNMLYTAGPSFILAFTVYAIVGVFSDEMTATDMANEAAILNEIEAIYQFSWLTIIPAVIVIISTVRRYPAAIAMCASSVSALVVGVVAHGFSVSDAFMAAVSGFNVNMVGGSETFSDPLNSLLNRGGIYSMSNTVILVFIAFIFAGAMTVSGALPKILNTMLEKAQSVFGLIAATMVSGATLIGLTSHGGVTALVVGGLFQDAYKEKGLAPENLSRSLEDSVTMLDPIMPWTVSGLFMAATLGVPTLEYLPWAIFCLSGCVFSLLIAAMYARTGFGIPLVK